MVYFLGKIRTDQCWTWLAKVFSRDQRRLHTREACRITEVSVLQYQMVSSHRTRECQAGRDCLLFLGAGCSMACLERRQWNSSMPVLLFPKELLNDGLTTV